MSEPLHEARAYLRVVHQLQSKGVSEQQARPPSVIARCPGCWFTSAARHHRFTLSEATSDRGPELMKLRKRSGVGLPSTPCTSRSHSPSSTI